MAQRSGGSAGSQPGSQPGKAHAGSLSNRLKGWGQRKGKGRSTPGLIPWDQFAGGNPKSVKPDTPAPASPAPASPADDDEPGAVAADAAAGSGTGTGTGGASHTAVVAATSSLRFWRSSKGKHTAADVANGNAAAAAAEGSAAADTDLDADQADTAVAGSSSHAAAVGATPRFWRSTKGKQPAPDAELLEMLQAERVRFVAEGFGDGILISTLQGIRCTSMRCDTASGDGKRTRSPSRNTAAARCTCCGHTPRDVFWSLLHRSEVRLLLLLAPSQAPRWGTTGSTAARTSQGMTWCSAGSTTARTCSRSLSSTRSPTLRYAGSGVQPGSSGSCRAAPQCPRQRRRRRRRWT